MSKNIEKAHNVGDVHPNGKLVWTEYKPGKFDWRGRGKTNSGDKKETKSNVGEKKESPQKKITDSTPEEIINYAKNASTSQLVSAVNDKKNDKDLRQIAFNELKTRDDYNADDVDSSDLPNGHVKAPDAKVKYKNGPKIDISVPDSFIIKYNGKPMKVSTSAERKKMSGLSDEELINKINNPKGTYINRQIAYEEAASRGIDESKLNFSGTLVNFWKKEEERKELERQMQGNESEDEAEVFNIDFKGFDMDAFMEKFPDGDIGWLNKKNPIVQRSFNFDTLVGRQQYDAVLDFQQRLLPSYLTPANKLGALNQEYLNFVERDTTPLFISSGGAGAGKSYGLWTILDYCGVPELKDEVIEDEEDEDEEDYEEDDSEPKEEWGWVNASNPEDEKDFRRMLARYNGTYTDANGVEHGHILVFDDADKILTSKQTAMDALMKKILDNNPEARVFVNPKTKKTEVWRGRIAILTNKDIGTITEKSEDKKAIISRGKVNNLDFTRNEVIEVLSTRYKTMGLGDYQKSFEMDFPKPEEQEKVRQIAFDFIKDHANDADPSKFTPRIFIDIISHIGPKIAGGNKVRKIGNIQVGTNIPWQVSALDMLKSDDNEFSEEYLMKKKKTLLKEKKKLKKSNPGLYNIIYGDKAVKSYVSGCANGGNFTKTNENKIKKSMEDLIGSMTVKEAEAIIFK